MSNTEKSEKIDPLEMQWRVLDEIYLAKENSADHLPISIHPDEIDGVPRAHVDRILNKFAHEGILKIIHRSTLTAGIKPHPLLETLDKFPGAKDKDAKEKFEFDLTEKFANYYQTLNEKRQSLLEKNLTQDSKDEKNPNTKKMLSLILGMAMAKWHYKPGSDGDSPATTIRDDVLRQHGVTIHRETILEYLRLGYETTKSMKNNTLKKS